VLYTLATFLGYFFLSGFIWGAGFEPTNRREIDTAAKLLGLHEGMTVYDLGSGTGDVLVHLAKKYKVNGVGIEVDPLKVWISRWRLSRARVGSKVKIQRANLLKADLSRADVIYVFLSGGTGIMDKLANKLTEADSQANVASYVHSFKDLQPVTSEGGISVYSFKRSSIVPKVLV